MGYAWRGLGGTIQTGCRGARDGGSAPSRSKGGRAAGHFVQPGQRDRQGEGTPSALRADEGKATAGGDGDLPGDAQAQPAPPVVEVGLRAGLREGFEDALLPVSRDARAAVLHADLQSVLPPRPFLTGNADVDVARGSEFRSVPHQVLQHLTEARGVSFQAKFGGIIGNDLPLQPPLAAEGGVEKVELQEHFPDEEGSIDQGQFPRPQFPDVQQVINHPQKVTGRDAERIDELALVGAGVLGVQPLGGFEDGVEGVADLVAHRAQEAFLGAVGLLGLAAGQFQFHLVLLAVGVGEDQVAVIPGRPPAGVDDDGMADAPGVLQFVSQFADLPLEFQQDGVVGLVVEFSADGQEVGEALTHQFVFGVAEPLEQHPVNLPDGSPFVGDQDTTGNFVRMDRGAHTAGA